MFSKEKKLETILAIVLGLLVIWYFTKIDVLVFVSVGLLIIGLFFGKLSDWITWGWLKLSHLMGWVMSKVILSAVFFLVLFPVAMLSRLFKKNDLQLRKSKNSTYYFERNHSYEKTDLENPW